MSFRSSYPDVSIPDASLFDYLFSDLEEVADLPALIDGTSGARTTFRQLVAQVTALAGGLAHRGFADGDVAGLLCPNIPAFVAVFHGILRAGGVVTTINSLATAEDITGQLRDSGASCLFTISMFLPQADAAALEVGLSAANIIVIDGSDTVAPGRTSLLQLLSTRRPAPDLVIDAATHLAVLPYSAGTTGLPKGVMLTHRNLVANLAQGEQIIGVTAQDRVLAVLPFFHIYGLNVLMNSSLRQRAPVITMPRFDLIEFLRVISVHRATFIYIAPPIAVLLAKHPIVDSYDTSSVRMVISGAAPLDTDLGRSVADRLRCGVRQGYGMTEMSPVSHAIPPSRDDIPLGTVGLALPNIECRIVDPATGADIGQPVSGTSKAGELWCRGPNVMVGYLADPDATAEVLDADGYLHTGDVATVSAEGYLTVVDRVKELIKYKGYQVPPAELEALLLTHPDIADAAVVGAPDADGEEVPRAFVVAQPDVDLTADQVITFVAERVASYKRIRQVVFIDSVPKSAAGKILRKDLRAIGQAEK